MQLAARAASGQPVYLNGQSVQSHIQTTGRDARRYQAPRDIRRLIDRFAEASRRTR